MLGDSSADGVAKEDHAVSEAALVEQLEGSTKVVGEHPLAASDEHRRHEDVAFVDQAGAPRRGRQVGAGDVEVLSCPGRDRSDEIGIEAALDPRALRGSRLQAAREDDLSAACQISANSALLGDWAATAGSFSQPIIISYMVRP